MAAFEKFRENWVRPALFFGNNPISLVGGALTSGSAVIMLGYSGYGVAWQAEQQSVPGHHYFFLILPFIFIAGLALIPVGVFVRYPALNGDKFSNECLFVHRLL